MRIQSLKHIPVVFLFCIKIGTAQPPSNGIAEIEKAVTEKKYEQADSILQTNIDKYYAALKADSLVNYIFYVGKVAHVKSGADQAIKKLELFISKIKTLSPGPATLRQTYIEAGEYYGFAGRNSMGYKANQEAYRYTLLIPGKTSRDLGLVENNLATYAQRMGDLSLSQLHGRQALKDFLADRKPDYEGMYIAYNGMGASMWYSSKIDSALYYFQNALQALEKAARTPINQYYRPAIVENNLSGLYSLQGKTTEAIQALKSAINKIKSFLASKEPNTKKGTAVTFQFEATDNLAGIYKELGDLKQAHELLEYSYRQKQQSLSPDDPAIFISQILLGQIFFALKDFDKSLHYLNTGLTMISKADGDHLFWQADACNTLALLYDAKDNNKQAAFYYEKADSLYEESLHGEYDDIYLDFLRNAALFYAENGQPKIAMAKAGKGYNYVVKTQGAQTLVAFYQLLNLSEVYLLSGRFKEALAYSKKGLDVVNKRIHSSNNLLDSIKMELKKPRAILLKSKATYQLLKKKDSTGLTILSRELNEALSVLERRKSIITDAENVGLIMADHNDLLEFAKKITFELYKLTNDHAYIDRLMSLQESAVYNRIRSRLDKNDSLQFADIPAEIRLEEKQLKTAATASLEGKGTHAEKIQRYFNTAEQWNRYQEKIKKDYPRYYKMRYASIFKPLDETLHTIPDNTSVIRYFFIGKELLAFVADNSRKNVYQLDAGDMEKNIASLSQYGMNAKNTGDILYTLYQQLWAPLAKDIRHKKIIIIPDGILYTLNFDLLTPEKINSFRELSTRSLLATHTISYQYSLFLLEKKNKAFLSDNFIAFAPGFSDQIKTSYRVAVKDPMEVDNTYLSLLPQPFTLELASKIQRLLGGNLFLNNQSTESSFKANAGNHKIIHIGTHAESNNEHPEFSKLIFAKNSTAKEDDLLFVDEIYNCSLVSDLTVLTACETGKPGYQDGEGMISLAHAFNYAGSESILTGLWKIDEQASALLMEFFYKNLLEGLPKDEALRQAKLSYLAQADGRMLAPQYWAGLVIMGDTSPVVLKQKRWWLSWIFGVAVLLLVATYLIRKLSKPRVAD